MSAISYVEHLVNDYFVDVHISLTKLTNDGLWDSFETMIAYSCFPKSL